MSNMMDYLEWRGDLSFTVAPFNAVDNLILSELAYMDYSGIVTGRGLPLAEAAEQYFADRREKKLENTALFQAEALGPLLEAASKAPRFAGVRMFCQARRMDLDRETQFAAVSFDLGEAGVYLAFSGTDDSLVGWKEDFNMSFMDAVPGQVMACDYLRQVAADCPASKLMLGGHSKGGNLAVYAALHAEPLLATRIAAVYNNDGPGFRDSQLQGPAYEVIRNRMHTIVPQSSVIGMLLEHDEEYRVVHSTQNGILQHDAFSWQVVRDDFEELSRSSAAVELNEKTLKNAIGAMDRDQLEKFTNAVFEILTAGGATTTTELVEEGFFRDLGNMSRAYAELSGETKKLVHETLAVLVSERLETKLNLWLEEAQEKPWVAYLEAMWGQFSRRVEAVLRGHHRREAAEEQPDGEPTENEQK